MQSNVTTLVSVDVTGHGEGNGHSSCPVISADGRFALFFSAAGNLVANTVTKTANVYWRDLQAGATVAITTASGVAAAAMTPDGRNVVAVAGSSGFFWQAASETTATVFTASSTLQDAAISPNGQKAVFGAASNIYVVDLVAGANELLTSALATSRPRFEFSGDGRFLACLTAVSNINQIALYDLTAGTNSLISQAYNGGVGDGGCDSPTFSPDGRFIAYRSSAGNIVPDDTNGQPDVFCTTG